MSTSLRLFTLPVIGGIAVLALLAWSAPAPAMPAFARQYNVSCQMCHSAFPRLPTW